MVLQIAMEANLGRLWSVFFAYSCDCQIMIVTKQGLVIGSQPIVGLMCSYGVVDLGQLIPNRLNVVLQYSRSTEYWARANVANSL